MAEMSGLERTDVRATISMACRFYVGKRVSMADLTYVVASHRCLRGEVQAAVPTVSGMACMLTIATCPQQQGERDAPQRKTFNA